VKDILTSEILIIKKNNLELEKSGFNKLALPDLKTNPSRPTGPPTNYKPFNLGGGGGRAKENEEVDQLKKILEGLTLPEEARKIVT
jgi:thymidylate synthase